MEPDNDKMSRNKIFAEKRRAKLEEYASRFKFSQDVADLANGLNRDLSRGSSIASNQGSSQITHISESTLYPESFQSKRSRFPPSLSEVKKPRYNFPNWARGVVDFVVEFGAFVSKGFTRIPGNQSNF